MSLFSALSSSLSGLKAVTSQMQIVAKNISNASTEGYSEQGVQLESVSLGGQGGGVKVVGYTRATDTALFTTLCTSLSTEGYATTQNSYMQSMMTSLGMNGSSNDDPPLSSAMSSFVASWSELESAPESTTQQQAVINAASTLVTQIQDAYQALDQIDTQVRNDVLSTVSDLNSDLQNIAILNAKIATAMNSGQSASDLQDQRDQLIKNVAATTKVTVLQRAQGQIALYTPGGYALVDGTNAQSFSYNGSEVVSDLDPTTSLNGVLTGGTLEAEVAFRSISTPASTAAGVNMIQKARSQLDAIVSALTTSSAGPPETFAYAYANATGATGEASSFFTGTTINDFAVNATLLNGSETIKKASCTSVCNALSDSTRTFSATGLTVTGASYSSFVTSIMTNIQESASAVSTNATASTNQREYLAETLANKTGVDTDTETVKLTTLQNAYAACAKVMSVIQNMFDELENMVS